MLYLRKLNQKVFIITIILNNNDFIYDVLFVQVT